MAAHSACGSARKGRRDDQYVNRARRVGGGIQRRDRGSWRRVRGPHGGSRDTAALSKAPGLGKKGAQKIILELAGRIDLDQIRPEADGPSESRDPGARQVIEGLVSLGWRPQTAEEAVRQACDAASIATPISAEDVPRVLKLALSSLDRGR